MNLAPLTSLSIFPRKSGDNLFSLNDIKDFKAECNRTRELVDKVPVPKRRRLDEATRRMSPKDREFFLQHGNEFLVIYTIKNNLL